MKITTTDNGSLEIEMDGNDWNHCGTALIISIDEFALALDEEARALIIKRLDEEPINDKKD